MAMNSTAVTDDAGRLVGVQDGASEYAYDYTTPPTAWSPSMTRGRPDSPGSR